MDKHRSEYAQFLRSQQIPIKSHRTKQPNKNIEDPELPREPDEPKNYEAIDKLLQESETAVNGEHRDDESENSFYQSVDTAKRTPGDDPPPSHCHPSASSSSSPSFAHHHPHPPYVFPAFIPIYVHAYPPPFAPTFPPPFAPTFPPYYTYAPSPYIPYPYPFPTTLPSYSAHPGNVKNPNPKISARDFKNPNNLAASPSFKKTCLEFIKLGTEIEKQLDAQKSSAAATNAPHVQPMPYDMDTVLNQNVELLRVIKETLEKSTRENEKKRKHTQKRRHEKKKI